MSNLKFKSSTHPVKLDAFLGNRDWKTIGYATTVERRGTRNGWPGYSIYYHGNQIAVIEDYAVTISLAGWHTPTTRNRLNMILCDNYIPFTVGQKNYRQTLTNRETWETVTDAFESATFTMDAGVWTLSTLNGETL